MPGKQAAFLFGETAGQAFFFRHRKKNQERCHRFEAVDADQGFPLDPAMWQTSADRAAASPRPTLRAWGKAFPCLQ